MISALKWLWNKLKAAASWLWSRPVVLVAGAGALIGAWLMWRSNKNKIATLEDARQVQELKAKIARDEARADLLEKQAEAREPEVKALKAEITASKRRVLEIHEGQTTEDMSDEDVADLFTRTGL